MSLLEHPPPVPSPAALRDLDLHAASDDDLLAAVGQLEVEQRRLDAARSRVIGEVAARHVCERQAGLTPKAWVGHQYRVAASTAARQVAVANKLRVLLTDMADALDRGVITFDHAALVARLCTRRVERIVVELQPRFIELAQVLRFEAWAHEVRGLISLADQDGPGPLAPPTNSVAMSDGLDGELHLDVDLVGAAAASVRAALIDEAQRRYRAYVRAANASPHGVDQADDPEAVAAAFFEFPGRRQLLGEALVELVRAGASARPGATAPVTDVTLVVRASDPLDVRTPDGVRLQDDTVRRLLCDAVFHPVVVDRLGRPIDHGRAQRFFTPDQHRLARVRDGGCGHPGCDAPASWTHLHHVEHWEHDGPTDMANGLSGCPHHHSLWHSEGWDVRPDPDTHHLDHGFIIITPEGRILRSQQHGRVRPLVAQLGLD